MVGFLHAIRPGRQWTGGGARKIFAFRTYIFFRLWTSFLCPTIPPTLPPPSLYAVRCHPHWYIPSIRPDVFERCRNVECLKRKTYFGPSQCGGQMYFFPPGGWDAKKICSLRSCPKNVPPEIFICKSLCFTLFCFTLFYLTLETYLHYN